LIVTPAKYVLLTSRPVKASTIGVLSSKMKDIAPLFKSRMHPIQSPILIFLPPYFFHVPAEPMLPVYESKAHVSS
jgi:hypothetical protein